MIQVLLLDVDGVLVQGEAFSKHLERDYGISPAITAPFFLCFHPHIDTLSQIDYGCNLFPFDAGLTTCIKFL
ncbi:hypothetical protein KSZ_34500 [Dictyobacter formicarum]|uniref:FCP1 homology domain-containing protein n=1 Tax=Dictyobacter formicarum TaxID=2778368 RepID=A0ABQ3VIC5_9CHLR|nr:hypothetical protein KSZ_34500 [Dictyobacter formicarum]